jgi:3-oxoadipate enol-lactonase
MTMEPFDHDIERGMRNRRRILGDAWVDQSMLKGNAFSAEFQNFITRYAWHEVWGRPGLEQSTRRLIVLVVTAALGRWEEFELHCRASLMGGEPETRLSLDEVKEALIQLAIYAGVPSANTAFATVQKILREADQVPTPMMATDAYHSGVGRAVCTRSAPAIHARVREPRNGHTPRHTVVLSHALGADSMMWDDLANTLAEDCRVICFDHRGHGASTVVDAPCTMADLADDAARLLDEMATGPVVFIGLSMGGMVAQELALRHPQLVKALVIANASSGYDETGKKAWADRIAVVEAQGLDAIADATMQRWFTPVFHAHQAATVARWHRRIVTNDVRGYVAGCHAVMSLDTTDRLKQVKLPTLVIAAEFDQGTPPAMSERIAFEIEGAVLVVLRDAAHFSLIEQPQGFEQAVLSFLERVY